MKKFIFIISFLAIFSASFAQAMTVDEMQRLIAQLQQQIAQLQRQLEQISPRPDVWCHDFRVNLRIGDAGGRWIGIEVRALQTALEKQGFYKRAITGNFDEYTASAVVGFQEKYREDILARWGLVRGNGFVGPSTRTKLNELYGCDRLRPPVRRPVAVRPSITVLSPNGGERWVAGKTYTIQWNKNNLPADTNWRIFIDFMWEKTPHDRVQQSIFKELPNSGNIEWSIPSTITPGNYRILVMALKPGEGNATYSDTSDAPFSIVAPARSITILSPSGGERWVAGQAHDITWRGFGDVGLVDIVLVDHRAGPRETVIARNIIDPMDDVWTGYDWAIPRDITPGENAFRISIRGRAVSDDSDRFFSIVAGGLGLKDIENQLASVSDAVSRLIEGVRELLIR